MSETFPDKPQRRFVQTPTIVAVRLLVFALLVLLALYGLVTGGPLVRAGSALFVLISAAALAFGFYVMFRATRPPQPLPEPDHGAGAAAEASFMAYGERAKDTMRVYPLQTGSTLVSFGQFFKGNEGWVGRRAVWNMGADEATVFWAPVHAYLIDHPEQGPILVDTGISRAQTEKGYYSARKGGLTGLIWKTDDNYLPPQQELTFQLEQLGVTADDVEHVIMTHLHEDHVGELNRFAASTVHLSRAEWDDRRRMGYAPSYEAIENWNHFEFDSGCFYTFDASKDLFGDGSIILTPTYGHSFGHTSLFLQMGEYSICLAADALYTLRHLDPDSLAAFNYFGQEGFATQADGARRLALMQAALPDLIYIPTHDPFEYTFRLVQPFLKDGALSAEQRDALH
ncbi:MAG: N-acyl homoserine lactonase family protein, partial [Chloroflexota bacterium]